MLARTHGLDGTDYVPGQFVEEGFAARVVAGPEQYVVVVLRERGIVVPGSDTQYLLLLDRQGRLLDKLACSLNNRLTRMESGSFRTEVLDRPEAGAHLVIRFTPEGGGSLAGNWSHTICFRQQAASFGWYHGAAIPPAEWETQGLCRVAISDGS